MSGLGASSGAPSGTGGGIPSASSTTGAATTAEVAHVPVLHISRLLTDPEGEVAKVLHETSFEDQSKQAGACYDFLTGPCLVYETQDRKSVVFHRQENCL